MYVVAYCALALFGEAISSIPIFRGVAYCVLENKQKGSLIHTYDSTIVVKYDSNPSKHTCEQKAVLLDYLMWPTVRIKGFPFPIYRHIDLFPKEKSMSPADNQANQGQTEEVSSAFTQILKKRQQKIKKHEIGKKMLSPQPKPLQILQLPFSFALSKPLPSL